VCVYVYIYIYIYIYLFIYLMFINIGVVNWSTLIITALLTLGNMDDIPS